MTVRAFLYPGQGSQHVGMAADLFREDERFRALVAHAEGLVGRDLRAICLRGPERLLARTDLLQPLLVAVSLGYHGRLADPGDRSRRGRRAFAGGNHRPGGRGRGGGRNRR